MKKEIKDFYIISVLGMLLIALFYILIIPDLEAYSDSKTVYMCNNRIGNITVLKNKIKINLLEKIGSS